MDIYSDMGGALYETRTRLYRNAKDGGAEWLYAFDYSAGYKKWYRYLSNPVATIDELKSKGMFLSRLGGGTTQ